MQELFRVLRVSLTPNKFMGRYHFSGTNAYRIIDNHRIRGSSNVSQNIPIDQNGFTGGVSV